jgi:hypothetical protein
MFFPSLTIKILCVFLILVSLTGELINARMIGKRLKTGEMKAIPSMLTSSKLNIFWIIMLMVWMLLAFLSVLNDMKNILTAILNIYICFNWLYFKRIRRDNLLYNEKGISIQKLFEKFIPYESIQGFHFNGKIIILEKQKENIRLPKFNKKETEEVLELLNRNIAAQDTYK